MPWRFGLPFEVSVLATRRVMVLPSVGLCQSRGTVTSAQAVPGMAPKRSLRDSEPKSQSSQFSSWSSRCAPRTPASFTWLPLPLFPLPLLPLPGAALAGATPPRPRAATAATAAEIFM